MWSIFSRDPTKDFAFEIGENVGGLEDQSIWTLQTGKRKTNGEPVSIFSFDVAANSDAIKQVALATVKRLKTLRHPNVLTFIDSLETQKAIYIVTEPVTPLSNHLKNMEQDLKSKEVAVSWGVHQITKGLSFLLNTVNLIHNNVCMSSVFVDSGGEWKLGGIDYMYPASGEGSNLPPFKTLPILEKYDPPEKTAKNRNKRSAKWSADMWGMGCLIWEVFNGPLPRTSSLKVLGKVPKNLIPNYCELVGANPASRPSPDTFIGNCRSKHSFMDNHFVDTNLFLEEIQIKDQKEKTDFFTGLPNYLDSFPVDYSKHKILPQLLNAFQFGNAGPAVLPPLFKLGSLLDSEDYQNRIVPCVIKLFSSTDRATRIHLLRQLPQFVEHLKPQVTNTQIFPNIITGFMDTNPAIREQSIKAMLLLAPKLNDNNLNNELMKHFARLQSRDDQGPIRTNTTVCLGKIACHLSAVTRQKVVSSAFMRAMRDPFPAARIAGILAMANNLKYYSTKDCAYKALPSLCALTIDPDKNVRVNAFKTTSMFLEKLEKASEDPEFAAVMDEEAAAVSAGTTASVVAGVTGWTGWMSTGVSSLTSRLYKKQEAEEKSNDVRPPTAASDAKLQTKKPETAEKDEVETKEENDDSDYGDNSVDDDWKDDGGGWDDIEEFISPITPMPRKKSGERRKLVVVSKLRAMEDDVWSHLNEKTKLDDEEDEEQEEENDSTADWGDSGWDADGYSSSAATSPKSYSSQKPPSKMKLGYKAAPKQKSSDWDDWGNNDDFGFGSEWSGNKKDPEAVTKNGDSFTPASTYNWSESKPVDPNSDEFFSQIISEPALKASQKQNRPTTKKLQAKAAVTKSQSQNQKKNEQVNVKTVEVSSKSDERDWQWGDEAGWGEDDGLSKAEQLKKQREEKRQQRQQELERKRAARASGAAKLGSRKVD